jgi:hypothetical protein
LPFSIEPIIAVSAAFEQTCETDTLHLTAADIRREQEIEELEEEIKALEGK